MPVINSHGEVRIGLTNVRADAVLLNAEYGGMTAFSLTGGMGSTEETGGYTRAVDIVSDEFDVRSGSLALLDTLPNRVIMRGGRTVLMLTGQRRFLWIAEAGTRGANLPAALPAPKGYEYGPIEVLFSSSPITVTVPPGGVWTLPFDVDGAVEALAVVA